MYLVVNLPWEVKVKKFLPKMSSDVTNDAEEALKEMWL